MLTRLKMLLCILERLWVLYFLSLKILMKKIMFISQQEPPSSSKYRDPIIENVKYFQATFTDVILLFQNQKTCFTGWLCIFIAFNCYDFIVILSHCYDLIVILLLSYCYLLSSLLNFYFALTIMFTIIIHL